MTSATVADRCRARAAFVCVLAIALGCGVAAGTEAAQKKVAKRPARSAAPPPVDMTVLQTQVMLDRAGYSPGEIDGAMGTSTTRALQAYTSHGGKADALPSDAVTTYKITEQDAAGPFVPRIPEDMIEKSKLPSLGYTSIIEALGERFHASPALLKRLNPSAAFAANEEI